MTTPEIRYWTKYPPLFPRMASVLPDGATVGRARILHITPTKMDAALADFRAMRGRGRIQAGETICQLHVADTLWMSDTPDERADHRAPVREARGEVLIAGLGLGLVTLACALKPEVTKVTVLEIDPDVVALVGPYLEAAAPGKIEIIQADVFAWKLPNGQAWDCIWFDIWPSLCTDDLAEHERLNRRFARRTRGYRGAWGAALLRRYQRAGW